jgi:transposase
MSWRRGQAYGQDLRDRVLNAQGTLGEVAQRYEVSPTYVSRVRSSYRRQGQTSAARQCNHVQPRLHELEDAIKAQISAQTELTLVQLCQWTLHTHAIKVGQTTMWKMLRRWGLSRKKRQSEPQSSHTRT